VVRSDRIIFNKQAGWWLKVWLWAVLGLALVLAAGLPGLTLDEQRITYSGEDWTRDLLTGDAGLMPVIMVGLVALSLILFVYLRQQRGWRRAWPVLLLVGLMVGGCMVVISYTSTVEVEYPEEELSADNPEQEIDSEAEPLYDPGIIVEMDEFTAPPAWVGLIVSTLIAFLILFMFISIYLFYLFAVHPFGKEAEDEEPLTEVVEQARTAISALKQGQPLANVVLRCYADMEQTLRANRGIERHQTMTAREFEQQLVQLGLPAEAVRTLTRLFETVRYGHYAPRPEDQKAAIDSLTQIVIASGGEGTIDVEKTAS
jgi:hypothetical protein